MRHKTERNEMSYQKKYEFKTTLGCFINSLGVYKYVEKEGAKIYVVIERAMTGKPITSRGRRFYRSFESHEEYETWRDTVTKERDWHYNSAQITADLMRALGYNV